MDGLLQRIVNNLLRCPSMSFMDLFFGRRAAVPAPSAPPGPQGPTATRRELLRVVLRDTLKLHGLPAAWIGAEMLGTNSRDGKHGIHLRLLIQHWEPRLLAHTPALQDSLTDRLKMFDPLAGNWFGGISWQFALADASGCPPMPAASHWTAPANVALLEILSADAAPQPVSEPVDSPLLQNSQPTVAQRRAALELMLAESDRKRYADGAGDPDAPPNFEATQPMFRATEPAGL